jgi:hypothetical protein
MIRLLACCLFAWVENISHELGWSADYGKGGSYGCMPAPVYQMIDMDLPKMGSQRN